MSFWALFWSYFSLFSHTHHHQAKDNYQRRQRHPIMHGANVMLRQQLTRLLLLMVSLKVDFDLRCYTLAFVTSEGRGSEIVRAAITDKLMVSSWHSLTFFSMTSHQIIHQKVLNGMYNIYGLWLLLLIIFYWCFIWVKCLKMTSEMLDKEIMYQFVWEISIALWNIWCHVKS